MSNRLVVLDTETTGLSHANGDRLIEVGCVEMINRKLTGRVFHEYIQPDREVSYGAYQVHGISTEFLKDKPRFAQIAEKLKDFLEGAELIIHNAPFDVGFLEFEFGLIDDPWTKLDQFCTITDTLQMARKMHPGQKNNLDALCKRYNVDNAHRAKHGALLDAEILADLYLVMTGGQTDMMLETASTKTTKAATITNLPRVDLPVVKASAQECAEHEAFIEKMKGKGACLWETIID